MRGEAALARDLLHQGHQERVPAGRSRAHAVHGELGAAVREALHDLLAGASEVIAASMRPVGVLRGGEDTEPTAAPQPAILTLPASGAAVLGTRVGSRAVLGEDALRIWLSGVTALEPGIVVVLSALTAADEVVSARATVREGTTVLKFELVWEALAPPNEIAIALFRA